MLLGYLLLLWTPWTDFPSPWRPGDNRKEVKKLFLEMSLWDWAPGVLFGAQVTKYNTQLRKGGLVPAGAIWHLNGFAGMWMLRNSPLRKQWASSSSKEIMIWREKWWQTCDNILSGINQLLQLAKHPPTLPASFIWPDVIRSRILGGVRKGSNHLLRDCLQEDQMLGWMAIYLLGARPSVTSTVAPL